MSNSILDHSCSIGNGNGGVGATPLLTIGQAAAYLNVHPNTIRKYRDSGRLPCTRRYGNSWTMYNELDLRRAFGLRTLEYEGEKQQKKIAILCRVSSEGQDKKGYLLSQENRMKNYVVEKYGENNPLIYSEVCSAFGNRQSLYKCIDDVLQNKINRICVEYQDRLSRTPALTNLVFYLCKRHNTIIEYVNKSTEDPNSLSENLLELSSYIMHLNAKFNGRKSGERRRITLPDEAIRRAFLLRYEDCLSSRIIADVLKKENFRDNNGNVIKHSTLANILNKNYAMLCKLYGDNKKKNSFEVFAEKYISKVSPKSNRISKLSRAKIVHCYYYYCETQNPPIIPISQANITRIITQKYKTKQENVSGNVLYHNLYMDRTIAGKVDKRIGESPRNRGGIQQ